MDQVAYGGTAKTHSNRRRKLRAKLAAQGYPADVIERQVEALRIRQGRVETEKPLKVRKRVLIRDAGLCRYCGFDCTGPPRPDGGRRYRTYDHVFPRSRGGLSTFENLVIACSTCNFRKRDRTPEEAGMVLLPEPEARPDLVAV